MTLPAELASLPAPVIIEEISIEASRQAFVALLQAEFDAAGIDFEVGALDANPAAVLMRVVTYIDANLRVRINEAVRANLLPYSRQGDLDILAQFYDVTRLSGETDEALRKRVVLAIRGRSTGGTEPRYRSVALGADVRVADAAVYTISRDPTVHVAVFSTDNNGVADAPLLAAVDDALQHPAVRMVNDTIEVAAAARVTVNIVADVWLLPQTSATQIAAMEAALRAAWEIDILLGRDVTRSWVVARLMLDGVQKISITTPAADVVMPFNQAAALGAVTLHNLGRAY